MPVWLRLSIAGSMTLLVGMGIGRFSYTPMMPALIGGGALSAAEAGYVAAFNFAGYLAGALAAPWLRRQWGEAPALRNCLALSLICLFASIAPWGFAWLAFWRFLVGAAMAVMMIYSLAIVTRSAPPERLGAATGIVFTGVGVGIFLSGTLVPVLLEAGLAAAWAGLAALGAIGVSIGLWGWRTVGGSAAGVVGSSSPIPSRLRITPVVLALIGAQTMFTIGLIPHTIYWVDYLVRGMGRDIAFGGMHWALFGLGALSGTYLWGRLADRIGHGAGLVVVFVALAVGVAMPVILAADWAFVLSSLVVGAQPGFSAIISGRTHQLLGAARMPQVWRWMALVSGVLKVASGYAFVALFDFTGSYTPVFLAGAAAMTFGAAISLGLGRAARSA